MSEQPEFTPPPLQDTKSKPWYTKTGCLIPIILVVLFVFVGSCSALVGDSDDDKETTTTEAPASTATEAPATTIAFLRDEARFRTQFERREPERIKEFSDADLLKWGDQACAEMSDQVSGATDDLERRMKSEGVRADLAERTASDFTNSAAGSLCDPPGAL